MSRFDNGRRRWPGLERLRIIDERCDHYEREWRAARGPRIEDYLAGLDGQERTATWLELVMLDQELRRGQGETPALADYRESCPDAAIWLDVSTGDLPMAVPEEPAAEDVTFAGCLADLFPEGLAPARAAARVDPPAEDQDGAVTARSPGGPPHPLEWPGTVVPTPEARPAEGIDGLVLARPGACFGDYVLIDRLGSGGMGVVFRARQQSLKREVALKMIKAGDLADPRHVRMFRAEAEAVAELDHPRIVPVLDSGEHRGVLYYSMKLIKGRDLGRCLGAFRDRPAAIARLVEQIAGAIAHAHERGILHRDIKPSNILIDAKGEPHVIDFGLVKRLGVSSESSAISPTGGTPGYMAPEQARHDRAALTTATDVYGLGALLYTLLAGRPPFAGGSNLEVVKRVIEEEPPRPRHRNPRVDADLETICLKAMNKDPRGRYPSARELAEDLERWLAGRPILARPASPVERAVKWVRRRKLIAALSAAAVIGAVVGVSGLAWGWSMAAAARDRALEDEDVARHDAYASALNLSERDWRDANIAEAIRHLKETIPPAGKSDLRGFEWYYLDRLTRSQGRALAGHTDSVRAVAYSRDGRRIASVGEDRTVKLWDAETGRLIRSTDAAVPLFAVAFHPDGTRLATAGDDFAVTIRDVATGQVIRSARGHTKRIVELEYSPDGKTLASSSYDGTIRLWQGGDGSPIRAIEDHPANSHTKLAFSPDGKALASSGGTESTVRLWDVAAARPPRTIADDLPIAGEGPGGRRRGFRGTPKPVAFSPDGKVLATGAEDGTIRLRDPADGRLLQTLRDPHHRDAITGLAFSPDGQRLTSFPYVDRSVSVWDVANGDLVRIIKVHTPQILDITFDPDGVDVAVACADSAVRILDASRDQEARTLTEAHAAIDVAFAPDGSFLATAVQDGTVTIRDLTTGQVVRTLKGHVGEVGSVVIAPDGRHAASAGEDRTVRVWDLATGNALHTLRGHAGPVYALAFSPDGKAIASASEDRTVKLWDPQAGRAIRTLEGPAFAVFAVAFTTDGKSVIAGDGDGFVTVWDAASGRRLRATKSESGSIMAIAASPDGRRLATGRSDHTIRIQDLADGREIRVFAGHAATLRGLGFSPDGRRLASAADDGTVRIWDPASGRGVLVLRGHSGPVGAVAFSPDGMRLASASADQTVRIWEAERAPAENPPGGAPGAMPIR